VCLWEVVLFLEHRGEGRGVVGMCVWCVCKMCCLSRCCPAMHLARFGGVVRTGHIGGLGHSLRAPSLLHYRTSHLTARKEAQRHCTSQTSLHHGSMSPTALGAKFLFYIPDRSAAKWLPCYIALRGARGYLESYSSCCHWYSSFSTFALRLRELNHWLSKPLPRSTPSHRCPGRIP
jgi:hypothetical protein